ncbi:MAG: Ppx/GppA family phosphatase [Deltaproteobacteria bacterium]|nr:Ppx/GppA family phosphatase [Deltaproteobacteria bacterium]
MSAPELRAAIDIGTNSVLLLVARVDPAAGTLERVVDRATITRLGQGVDRARALHPDAVERTLACLRAYALELQALGVQRPRVVATSAARDASNADALLVPARALLGAPVETISGEREARLTFRGTLLGLGLAPETPCLTFDIGGGSTELTAGLAGAEPTFARSLDVGSVRLTERHGREDPPSAETLQALDRVTREALGALGAPPAHAVLVGSAGTVTSLSALCHGVVPYESSRIHGSRLDAPSLDRLVRLLAGVPTAERARLAALDPRRADVIVAGAVLARNVLRWAGDPEVRVSDGGVRVGLLLEPDESR